MSIWARLAILALPLSALAAPVTISGSLRTRAEFWDWFQGAANNDYAFSGSLLRVSLAQTGQTFGWQLEFALPVLLGLPDNATAPGAQGQFGLGAAYFAANARSRNAALPFVKQGFIRYKSVQAGRMEFFDGLEAVPKDPTLAALVRGRIAQRLIGNFAFSHVGRSFDGARYSWDRSGLNVTLFAARPTRGVFQVDGWGDLNVNVYYGALTGELHDGQWRVFGLGYSDYRDVLKTDNRPLPLRTADKAHINIGTYGAHFLHTFQTRAGVFDALLWGALQSGSWGALAQRAGAFAAEAGWQPRALPKLKPWLRGGFDYGSGDKNPADGTHGTFFQVLPTARVYARFPFFDMMNMRDAFGELILRPHKSVNVRADVHSLRLANRNDLWYLGGGAFQPWTFGYTGRPSNGQASLATLFDASLDYAISPHAAATAYFGHAAGKLVTQSIYPAGKNANFGYLELTLRF